jgi:hypothetical protein
MLVFFNVCLNRDYYFWSKDKRRYIQTKVQKVVNDGIDQIKKYIEVVGKGKASNKKIGIYDEKIRVEEGIGRLGGYLIASLGTQNIIVKSIGFKRINYNFAVR